MNLSHVFYGVVACDLALLPLELVEFPAIPLVLCFSVLPSCPVCIWSPTPPFLLASSVLSLVP